MSRGKSGRIVIEIDVPTKNDLYLALAREGLTLKDWFLRQAGATIDESRHPSLFGPASARGSGLLARRECEQTQPALGTQ